MLSIVKMDLDSDPILDENLIKSEVIDIEEESIQGRLNRAAHSLESTPIVYTTRLDDMTVLKSYSAQINPKEATNRIINESKPILRTLTINSKRKRRNKKRFLEMNEVLQEIYCTYIKTNNNDETDVIPDTLAIQIDQSSVKSEVQDDPIDEKPEPNDKCKYSELLKLCKPCSVMLGPPVDKVIRGGQKLQANRILQANRVVKPRLSQRQSTDDEDLLITYPDLLEERTMVKTPANENPSSKPFGKIRKYTHAEVEKIKVNVADLSHITQRLMRSGLLEIYDTYSKECHVYYTDNDSNLLDYFRNVGENFGIYETTHPHVDCKYIAENCCWVKRENSLKSLYPKMLSYPNARFMRRPHPCKPGACVCCCRKKENIQQPRVPYHVNQSVPSASTSNDSDKEMKDLEDEIDKSIININRTPKLDSSEWLQDLITKRVIENKNKTNTLISKALSYKKPLPKKNTENRRLVTFQKGETQNAVVILRNFAMDVMEIYAFQEDGDIETYIKTTCYNNNISQPDVKKLLKNQNAINETVCCWFKREEVVIKLRSSQELHPSSVKFIRTNHTCPSNECTCCCKPVVVTKKDITLTDVSIPSRKSWSKALQSFRSSYDAECGLEEQSKVAPPKTVSVTVQLKHNEPPPLVFMQPSNPSTSQNDDDCEITSVTPSPRLQRLLQNPPVPPKIPVVVPTVPLGQQGVIITDVVNDDELSQEVNSLITSILERFKDVKLTINDNGKVAAALNTPVNTLSTVELKVLVNILSYAQSQVNSLGLKGNAAGMSLSNIINFKTEGQDQSTLDPHSVYKAFGKNVNMNTNAQNGTFQFTNVNTTPPVLVPTAVLTTIPQTYNYFTNSMTVRNQHFNDSFSSYMTTKFDSNPPTESFAPVIQNVFTVKEETDQEPSSTTVWYRKPGAQQTSVSTENTSQLNINSDTSNDNKRKDIETQTTKPIKKFRVVSPTKLGATSNNEGTAGTSVENVVSRNGLASSTDHIPFLGNAQMQPAINLAFPTQPVLIINPLNTPNSISNGADNPEMPIIVSNVSMTQSGNVISPQTPVPTEISQTVDDPEEEYVVDDIDNDIADNNGDVDYNLDDSEMDNEGVDYCADEPEEEKYAPDNEEEEDCILGF